jgi:hypothetical protein
MKKMLLIFIVIIFASSVVNADTQYEDDYENETKTSGWATTNGGNKSGIYSVSPTNSYFLEGAEILQNSTVQMKNDFMNIEWSWYTTTDISYACYILMRDPTVTNVLGVSANAAGSADNASYYNGVSWVDMPDSSFNTEFRKYRFEMNFTNFLCDIYIDDIKISDNIDCFYTDRTNITAIIFDPDAAGSNDNCFIDDLRICDGACNYSDTTPPTIQTYNCTSCGGDNESPYTTQDTTPTFTITTNLNANCAIGTSDENYSTMVSNIERNCTTTSGTSHICTLPYSDGLIINETDDVYIACQNIFSGNENITSTSGAMFMDITTSQTEVLGEDAIRAGINSSAIWPSNPTLYQNQQVYIRDLNDNQVLGTFDWFVSYSDKRWGFNYLTGVESFISGLFNITPSFYTEEYQDLTYKDVNDSVRTLIDNTYT